MTTRNDDRRRDRPSRYSREQQPIQPRVTDQEIQKWISRQHGFVPESAWLLHCKEQFGLVAPGTAPKENRVLAASLSSPSERQLIDVVARIRRPLLLRVSLERSAVKAPASNCREAAFPIGLPFFERY